MQYWLELPMMWFGSALLWLAGALLFVGVTGVLAVRMRRSEPWLMLGLFGAAAVLLVHNQIEMGFFQLAPTGLVWAIVGLAAAGRAREAQGPSHAGRLPGAAMCIVAVWLIVAAAGPFTRQQHHLAEAAAALQRNQYHAALEALDAAGEAIPRHSETLKQRVHLRLEAATALAQHGRSDEAREMLREASAVVEHAERLGMPGPRVPRLRAAIEQTAARALGQTQRRAQAAAALREAIRRTPYDLRYRLDLGDLYWHMDQRDAAAAQYRSALRTSEQSYLDPTKQLTTEQRAHVEARLGDGR
ncbi:MAG: hypothetical protein ACODAQ_06670, partial [Phycisphaeraceae bacterium]